MKRKSGTVAEALARAGIRSSSDLDAWIYRATATGEKMTRLAAIKRIAGPLTELELRAVKLALKFGK